MTAAKVFCQVYSNNNESHVYYLNSWRVVIQFVVRFLCECLLIASMLISFSQYVNSSFRMDEVVIIYLFACSLGV